MGRCGMAGGNHKGCPYQPGRRWPQLPQNTSRMGPFSWPQRSQVQMGTVIEVEVVITVIEVEVAGTVIEVEVVIEATWLFS